MMTAEHWAIIGQTFVVFFAVVGIIAIGYAVNKAVTR